MTPSSELLAAIEKLLRDDVMGQLDAFAAYQARIAANLLALLRREQALGADLATLDADFGAAHGLDTTAMPGSLALALRDGRVGDSAELRAYLRRRSLLSLAIDNPQYSGYAQARDAWPTAAKQVDDLIAEAANDDNQPTTQGRTRDGTSF